MSSNCEIRNNFENAQTIQMIKMFQESVKQNISNTNDIIQLVQDKIKSCDLNLAELKQSASELNQDFSNFSNNLENINSTIKDIFSSLKIRKTTSSSSDSSSSDNESDSSENSSSTRSSSSMSVPSSSKEESSSSSDDDYEFINKEELNEHVSRIVSKTDRELHMEYHKIMKMLLDNCVPAHQKQI